jgi:hypothetical protein
LEAPIVSEAEKPKLKITIDDAEFEAELNGSKTAEAIAKALPIVARGSFWGEEIYFSIPVRCEPEDPRAVVEKGTLAYWPPGTAFCIFWGATPASQSDECRAASPVNVVGRITSDLQPLKSLRKADVRIERMSA